MFLQQAYELTPKSRRSHCTAAVDDRERARRRCKLAHKGQRAPHRPKVVASHPHDEQPRSCVDILDCNRARGSADVLPVQQNNVPSKPCRNKDVPSSPKFSCTASRMTFASNDALSSTLLRVPPSLLLLSPLSPGCRPLPRTSPSKYLRLKRTISGKLCYQSAFLFFLFFSFFFFFLFWLLVWRRHVYVFASCRPGCHRGEGEKNKKYLSGADDSIFAQHGCSWLAHEKALGLLLVRCFCSCLDLSCHPSPLRTPSPPPPPVLFIAFYSIGYRHTRKAADLLHKDGQSSYVTFASFSSPSGGAAASGTAAAVPRDGSASPLPIGIAGSGQSADDEVLHRSLAQHLAFG